MNNSETLDGAPCPHGDAECGRNSSCVLWERGWFAPAAQCNPSAASPTPGTPAACPAALSYPGRFDLASGVWLSEGAPCSLRYYTPAEAYHEVLRGRCVAFAGDSIMRRFFLRLLHFLRGFTRIGDRRFHTNAVYSRNASADYLSVEQLPDSPLDRQPVNNAELVVTFEWAPDHRRGRAADGEGNNTDFEIPADAVLAWLPDVAVIGLVYWQREPNISSWQKAQAARVAADESPPGGEAEGAGAGRHHHRRRRTFWLGTPRFPDDYNERELDRRFSEAVPARNADMRQFCASRDITFLPLDYIDEAGRGDPTVRPSLHYQARADAPPGLLPASRQGSGQLAQRVSSAPACSPICSPALLLRPVGGAAASAIYLCPRTPLSRLHPFPQCEYPFTAGFGGAPGHLQLLPINTTQLRQGRLSRQRDCRDVAGLALVQMLLNSLAAGGPNGRAEAGPDGAGAGAGAAAAGRRREEPEAER